MVGKALSALARLLRDDAPRRGADAERAWLTAVSGAAASAMREVRVRAARDTAALAVRVGRLERRVRRIAGADGRPRGRRA